MPLNLIFIQPGTYTIEDNGIPGDNISVIKDQNGVVIFTFGHPADGLGFTVSTPGVNIVVNFTDSMNAANFTIGNPANAAESPDSIVMQNIVTTGTVTLFSNGDISEGATPDMASDITAGALIMGAVSGIGTANAIETRTGLFEAETTTGGISINNFGAVQIGGISADVDGLDVATSGNISFINTGSIFLTEANSVTAGEVVHGGGTSGNVTLLALGASSDIIANVDNGAVSVPRGSVLMTAGRDIQLGTIGTDFNNDVITNNNLTLNAGRDILIDGFADILSDNFGLDTGGNLTFTAGRNIGILAAAGTSASVVASGAGGGDVVVTTGFGGSLTVNGPGSFGLGSTSGNVTVRADRLLIDAGSGISAPAGSVTIRTATDGRAVLLGSATDAAIALELSDTELNRIFTPNLTLGHDQGGQVRVVAPINIIGAGTAPDVVIRSGTNILLQSNISVVDQLSLISLDDVFQSAASVITANSLSVQADSFDDDVGTGGIVTLNGTVTVAASNLISGNADADTLSGSDQANNMLGNGGSDTLRGRGGNDFLDGGTGADKMFGGLGDDTYFIDNAADTVTEEVGEGRDKIFSNRTLTLGDNVEDLTLQATAAAASGNGNGLDNLLTGNDFANSLSGFDGDDTLVGNAGWDNLFGGSGDDELFGGAGNDNLDGGTDADNMAGGTGEDTYLVDTASDSVIELAGEGRDKVLANVTYTLAANVDDLTLQAAAGVANGTGNGDANVITGNAVANTLSGLGGNDVLIGNAGADTLNGGFGNDTLNGGTEADMYFFTTALGGNIDTILGFQVGLDKIVLENSVFSTLAAGALPPGAFRTGAAAGDADDRIIYNSATGAIFYDADGNGAGAAVQFATVSTGLALAASDFTVI